MAFYADFAGYYEAIFPLREAAAAFLQERLPARGRLLDLGCGTGRYCARLAGPERPCEGADPDPGMIARARELVPDGAWHELGMEDVARLPAGGYAGVFCIGNVLPHLPVPALPAFLGDVHRLLEPDGTWIFQTVNFDPLLDLAEYEFPPLLDQGRGLCFLRSYRRISADRLSFRTRLARDGREIFAGETDLHPRTSAQYRALHEAAGFTLVEHAADWSGKPFTSTEPGGSVWVWRRSARSATDGTP